MAQFFPLLLIALPAAAAGVVFFCRSAGVRALLVGATVAGLAVTALAGRTTPIPDPGWRATLDLAIVAADFFVLLLLFFFGCRHRHRLIMVLTICQAGLLAGLEFFVIRPATLSPLFVFDALSLLLARVVCLVGGLICLFAIPYMAVHERHQRLSRSRQPVFFAMLLLFLGAMNGLALCRDILHFYFFFELTTLCSFVLISHDRSKEAVQNGLTALWMNSLGGLVLLLAIWGLYEQHGSTDILHLAREPAAGQMSLLPLALLLIAAFTKSAQLPFQQWLLGAMVAPTPVSALLHSSTMVKAGVYLALRFAPALTDTPLSPLLALAGGLVFVGAAGLALGQDNAKKVLACSTISNLGLIFACAGIGSPAAIIAGMLLILFHAVAKGLLFLCIGAAEQQTGSRDIEVLRGLYASMPLTTLCALVGIVTLILPPFGMLLGKWLVLTAGAANPLFFLLVGLGSAVTALYWVRLGGTLLGVSMPPRQLRENTAPLLLLPLLALAAASLLLSLAFPWLAASMGTTDLPAILLGGNAPTVLPALAAVTIGAAFWGLLAMRRSLVAAAARPYLSGADSPTPGHFIGPGGEEVTLRVGNYYLASLCGEARLGRWLTIGALAMIGLLLTGDLWR